MLNIVNQWKKGLGKTRMGFIKKLSNIIQGRNQIDESMIEGLEEVLIEADVGVETTVQLIDDLKQSFTDQREIAELEDEVRKHLKEKIIRILNHQENFIPKIEAKPQPYVILVVGVNGTGKTTTIGKLAYKYHNEGKKVLLAAADTFRAAAVDQLMVWGNRIGVDIIGHSAGSDPAAVTYDALDGSIARGVDVLIIDTAGRLHTKINLMEELKKIKRVLKKRMETAPHEVLLVLDATTGQNGLKQAEQFFNAIGVTGIALTKLDGTARGGIVIAIHERLKIPVKWIGVGETNEDLIEFSSDLYVNELFGSKSA